MRIRLRFYSNHWFLGAWGAEHQIDQMRLRFVTVKCSIRSQASRGRQDCCSWITKPLIIKWGDNFILIHNHHWSKMAFDWVQGCSSTLDPTSSPSHVDSASLWCRLLRAMSHNISTLQYIPMQRCQMLMTRNNLYVVATIAFDVISMTLYSIVWILYQVLYSSSGISISP